MSDIVSASHDVVFKALFVRNQDILRAFLCDMLDLILRDEDEVIVLNPELIPELSDEKLSRLDIHVIMADRKFNIEMQASRTGFSVDRVLYYWSKLFIGDFKRGGEYPDLEQTYSVNILDFKYLDGFQYHSSYALLEEINFQKLTDKLSIHIFELSKVPEETVPGDNKQMWMELIKADSKEALDMIKTKTQNPAIQKGADAVYALNADTVIREQIR